MKENKEEKSLNKIKEKKFAKIIEIIKKRWLVDGTKTLLLIAIIIMIFIGINSFMQKIELTPIDFSQEKLYTLTSGSKEKVKNIDKEVHIYFIGFKEEDTNFELAKQYKKVNNKIVAEIVNSDNRPDLMQKYGLESSSQGIILECGEKSKVLAANDLVTYDQNTYETVNIAEEKLTSSILSVTSDKIPKIYFLEGYSNFYLSQNMNYLSMYLENEVNEILSLNILTTGKVPEDCDTLVVTTPEKDFDDIATNAIIEYINLGGNILWLNGAITDNANLENVNKILSLFAVNPFDVGTIRETNTNNMVSGTQDLIIPEIQSSVITKDLTSSSGVIFVNSTKINIDDSKLGEEKIDKTELLLTSDGSYFRSDFNNSNSEPTDEETKTNYLVGVKLEKTISEANDEENKSAIVSKLILYAENYFITDYPITQNSRYPIVQMAQNKDLVLNSLAYLVERPEDIVARKSTGTVTYTATEKQDIIIRIIIFAFPIFIIILGIIVWIIRKRKK